MAGTSSIADILNSKTMGAVRRVKNATFAAKDPQPFLTRRKNTQNRRNAKHMAKPLARPMDGPKHLNKDPRSTVCRGG
jgi:hypothetical protein